VAWAAANRVVLCNVPRPDPTNAQCRAMVLIFVFAQWFSPIVTVDFFCSTSDAQNHLTRTFFPGGFKDSLISINLEEDFPESS